MGPHPPHPQVYHELIERAGGCTGRRGRPLLNAEAAAVAADGDEEAKDAAAEEAVETDEAEEEEEAAAEEVEVVVVEEVVVADADADAGMFGGLLLFMRRCVDSSSLRISLFVLQASDDRESGGRK